MKFEPKSIGDVLRFLVTGYVVYAVTEYSGIKAILSLPKQLGPAEKTFIIFAAGAVIYFLFRTVIYPWLVQRMLVDRLNSKENIRSYLRKGRSIGWSEANDLYHLVVQRHPELPLDVDGNRLWSHSIYMLFISGGAAFLGAIAAWWFAGLKEVLFLAISGAVLLFAAVVSDVALERRIYRSVVGFHPNVLVNDVRLYLENKQKREAEPAA